MMNFNRLKSNHFWLKNAHVPVSLLSQPHPAIVPHTRDGLCCVDVEICDGLISQIHPSGVALSHSKDDLDHHSIEIIDIRQGIVFPCFVDVHTHLDKGHVWERTPNLEGTFRRAIDTITMDMEKYWSPDDVHRRMEFGLKCSYVHGTKAVRTHIDALGNQAQIGLGVFQALQAEWADRLTLQVACLVPLEYFLTPDGEKLADLVAEVGGVLGGFAPMHEALDAQLDRVFELATERGLDLDFHTDESGNPNDVALRRVALAALRRQFSGQIVCGHCCSLAVQPIHEVMETLELVKQAEIGVVSLPMCNLYLQDRDRSASAPWTEPDTAANTNQLFGDPESKILSGMPDRAINPKVPQTPRWRGVTLVHELHHAGIPVAFASDNCRDPFYGFGDHDVLDVFTQSTRIAHLDSSYEQWIRSVTTIPADLMGLPNVGRIGVGLPADLIVFKARYFSELLSRPQSDRVVLRQGNPIDTTLPDYSELDDLLF